MRQNKYEEYDNELEYKRYNFFKGLQADGDSICGTCKYFESILNKNGSIGDLGRCHESCPVKRGLDKVHVESNAKSYINAGIPTRYCEFSKPN